LFYGAQKSQNVARNLEKVSQFAGRFVSLPFDDNSAEAYGRIRAQLEQKGMPIGPNDMMIAAIAVANDVVLVTHNTGEFGRIQTLRLED
jgi:tRNA(fMet)-specific endonuclease VapC